MAIKDLKARDGNVELEAEIIELGDIREFEKFGKKGRVSSAVIKDDTGSVKLSLWNEQIDQVKVGNRVRIQKGYVNEYQGELQLTTGKFGTIEVIGQATSTTDNKEHILSEDEKTEEEVLEEQAPASIDESQTEDEKLSETAELTDGYDDFRTADKVEPTEDEITEAQVLDSSEEPSKEKSATKDELDIEEETI